MSTHHEVTLKPINEVAKFIKNLIPVNIPETYALKHLFKNVASEINIRKGIIAFRDFLYIFCDRLISDGQLYAKPPKKPSSVIDYPFLNNITCMLVEIGYHSKLSKSGNSLIINELPSCTASIDADGKKRSPNIPISNQYECLRFLTLCGFVFNSINLESKTQIISNSQSLEVLYPKNPIMLTGLKAMAISDKELRKRRGWNDNNLLQCDYRLIKAEETNIIDILKDFVYPLPKKVQKFALDLHQRYIDMGMICSRRILGDFNFAYAFISKGGKALSSTDIYAKSIWQFSYSLKNGYCLFVRAKKTDKYADVIENFPLSLQKKIKNGYGCDRKLRNEHCQGEVVKEFAYL
jgi:hypothetical protein